LPSLARELGIIHCHTPRQGLWIEFCEVHEVRQSMFVVSTLTAFWPADTHRAEGCEPAQGHSRGYACVY
jgi:hypothetical protein